MPAGAPCPRLASTGCGTYADRPGSCRGFACGWAAGMVPEPLRPDRSGVLQWVDGATVHVRELRPNAVDAWWHRRMRLWAVAYRVELQPYAG